MYVTVVTKLLLLCKVRNKTNCTSICESKNSVIYMSSNSNHSKTAKKTRADYQHHNK